MRFVNTEESKKEYKQFLENHGRCNFQQSLEWAEVKKPNWKPEVILAENEDGKIIGSLCVWVRKMPIFGNILYDITVCLFFQAPKSRIAFDGLIRLFMVKIFLSARRRIVLLFLLALGTQVGVVG